ncbi:hypothetical protein V6N11_058611 [Hibiscus sabdariffa]|uniref:Uncharacterized protein n=1 Tax=Hibiscus sabdariffa TaxID=183260 RepID=A0ABR2U5I7_9ROSI
MPSSQLASSSVSCRHVAVVIKVALTAKASSESNFGLLNNDSTNINLSSHDDRMQQLRSFLRHDFIVCRWH